MKILFYTREDDEYRRPDDVVSNDKSDPTLEFGGTTMAHVENDSKDSYTIYTEGRHFYIILNEEDMKKIAAEQQGLRQVYHEALDRLLDAADADGRLDSEGDYCDVQVQFVNIETKDDVIHEDMSFFNAEIASGDIEEMFVDHKVFKNGVQVGETRRFEIK